MKGEIKINGFDAWVKWGVSLTDGARTALMTPPAAKDYITNDSPLEHGQQYVTDTDSLPKTDAREVSLPLHFCATSQTQFLTRYNAFCTDILAGRKIELTDLVTGITYHLLYKSCSQYSAFFGGIAKFTLKVEEPNPESRTAVLNA